MDLIAIGFYLAISPVGEDLIDVQPIFIIVDACMRSAPLIRIPAVLFLN